jgi:hypothetical protein
LAGSRRRRMRRGRGNRSRSRRNQRRKRGRGRRRRGRKSIAGVGGISAAEQLDASGSAYFLLLMLLHGNQFWVYGGKSCTQAILSFETWCICKVVAVLFH